MATLQETVQAVLAELQKQGMNLQETDIANSNEDIRLLLAFKPNGDFIRISPDTLNEGEKQNAANILDLQGRVSILEITGGGGGGEGGSIDYDVLKEFIDQNIAVETERAQAAELELSESIAAHNLTIINYNLVRKTTTASTKSEVIDYLVNSGKVGKGIVVNYYAEDGWHTMQYNSMIESATEFYNEANWVDGISGGGNIEMDTEMSDTSENAVQNKVIKAYVDGKVADVKPDTSAIEAQIEDLQAEDVEIKSSITDLNNTKSGAFYADPNTGLFIVFNTEEAKEAYISNGDESGVLGKFNIGGGGGSDAATYDLQIKGLSDKYSYTTSSEKMLIGATYESKVKYASSDTFEPFNESAIFSIEVYKEGATSSTVVTAGNIIANGGTFSFDLKPYLGSGNNTVIVRASGLISGATGVVTTEVYVTSMALLPFDFNWWKPYTEGDTYVLGGLKILGSLNKTLNINVSNADNGYSKDYAIAIGTTTYDDIKFNYNGIEHPLQTGVYTFKLWLSSTINGEDIFSDTLTYNIICVASADASTAQLIAVNEVGYEIDNYAENKLFSYAVYNKSEYTATPTITLMMGDTTVSTSEQTVNVNSANEFAYSFAVTTSNATEQITASIALGTASEEFSFLLKNDASIAPTSGYSFCLDAATRSNSDNNKTMIVNEVDNSTINATWTDMSWVDGMDGWTTDSEGNKCLLIPAMSRAEIDLTPFKDKSIVSIAMQYKVDNASDFNDDIITIAKNTTESWIGVKVKPTNVTFHTQSLNKDDLRQGYNTEEGKIIHLVITAIQNYSGIGNLVMIYANGGKRCSFEWSTSDSVSHDGKLILGSDTADLWFYKMYIYEGAQYGALSMDMVEQNYKASLHSAAEKANLHRRETEILDDSKNLSYDKIYGKYNTFVVELPSGAKLPNKLNNPANVPIDGTNLYINIVQDPTCSINGDWLNVPFEGQGTTAMTYYRWNFRSKTSDEYDKFRITAKKNVASSMHSHKRGATALYNDLNRAIVGENEVGGRVAVYQYPAYGFLKKPDESNAGAYIYEPIGLYTIGPDKGDKSTFGYDNKTYKNTLIHMEGTDHSPRGVGMDYPWEQMVINYNADGDIFIGANNGSGGLHQEAWEVGACGDKEEVADMQAYVDTEFGTGYNLDYECTPLIVGLSSDTSIDAINADVTAFRNQSLNNGFTYGDCVIYIDGTYNTYYFNELSKTYVVDGRKAYKGLEAYGLDLSVLNAKSTVEEKTAYIKEYRRLRYRAEMGNYWHLQDNLYHPCFLDIIGATDNEKKNSYPYKFGTLASGSRWRWRQDDLDTMADINNQGSADKKYSILNTDTLGGTMIFKGNTSYHWRCVREYFVDELKVMMQTILNKMVELCPDGYGDSKIERLVGCIRHYFWDYAQDYFTIHAYNADAKWTYEDTWAVYKTNTNANAVHPLQQSLGSHYEAERAWFEMRLLFIASMYEFGAFADYVDTSEGQVSFRQGGDFTFDLTPAIDVRPSVIQGANSAIIRADGRINAGDSVSISTTADTSADTMVYIQGADWMQDIGDFSKVRIGSSSNKFDVTSKRLQKLKIGDPTAENVTTNIGVLNVGSCPSLVEIEARNVSDLSGDISLVNCPRLRRAYFGGTQASEILLPSGSKIEEFDIPSTLQRLTLKQLPKLNVDGLTYTTLTKLTYLWVENNTNLDGYEVLREALDGGSPLNNIRVVGFDVDGDATDVTFLATLANGNYHGIDANGAANNDYPMLQGTIRVNGNIYEEDKEAIESIFKNVIIEAIGYYVKFADPEVLKVLLANGVGDGTGITKAEAAAVTDIGTWFNGNTAITTFDELRYFPYLSLEHTADDGNGTFAGCVNLTSITIPDVITLLGTYAFRYCAKLTHINTHNLRVIRDYAFLQALKDAELDLSNLKEVGARAFKQSGLSGQLILPNITFIGLGAFGESNITHLIITSNLTTMPDWTSVHGGCFIACKNLTFVDLPSTLTKLGSAAFQNCSALETFLCRATTPPTYGENAIANCNSTFIIYVPDESVEAYKTASGWSSFASRIQPLSIADKIIFEIEDGQTFNGATLYIPITIGKFVGDVTWSIVSGSEYSSISQNGRLTVNENAENSPVTIRCESVNNPDIYDEVSIFVTYAAIEIVEYIKTAGTQWIDTGYLPNANTEIELDVQLFDMGNWENTNAKSYLFGVQEGNYTLTINHGEYSSYDPTSYDTYYMWSNTTYASGATIYSFEEVATLRAGRGVVGYKYNSSGLYIGYVGNTSQQVATPTHIYTTRTLALFANNKEGSVEVYNRQGMKIYGATISEKGVIKHHFVPAVQAGAFGLYDEMTDVFFPSNGEAFLSPDE